MSNPDRRDARDDLEEYNSQKRSNKMLPGRLRKYAGIGAAGLVVVAVACGALFRPSIPKVQAQAQTTTNAFVYAVQYACVPEVAPTAEAFGDNPLEPALYRTKISIVNPSWSRVNVIRNIHMIMDEEKGNSAKSNFALKTVSARSSFGIDCLDIRAALGNPGIDLPTGYGVVYLESPSELIVSAIYTGRVLTPTGQGQSATLAVQQVTPVLASRPAQ